jgi:hypothetical protein
MPSDLTVVLQDRPGELARLGEVAGAAGVTFKGIAAFTGEGKGFIHVLVDDRDLDKTCTALEREQLHVADRRDVLVVDLENFPDRMAEVMRALADANVNVDLAYTAVGGAKLVVATDDVRSARAALAA